MISARLGIVCVIEISRCCYLVAVHQPCKLGASASWSLAASILRLGVERRRRPCIGDEETASFVEKLHSEDNVKSIRKKVVESGGASRPPNGFL